MEIWGYAGESQSYFLEKKIEKICENCAAIGGGSK